MMGPGEIDDCLLDHPAIKIAGVIGKPDPQRTEIVKAFVVLQDGHDPTEDLRQENRDYVRTRLAAHEYPRKIEFIDELPMTNTGKVIPRKLRYLGDPDSTPG